MAAYSARHLCLLFLLGLLAHLEVEARESQFFSKVTHYTTKAKGDDNGESKPPHIEHPCPPPKGSLATPAPAPTYAEKEYGFGLYGRDSDKLQPSRETNTPATTTTATITTTKAYENTATPTTTTTTAATTAGNDNFEDDIVNEELSSSSESFTTGYTNGNYDNNNAYTNTYNYNADTNIRNTNGYTSNYDSNVYTAGVTDTYYGNGNSKNYNTNGGYSSNYNSNSYAAKKQGMSDTRFLENGKYYYNVKNDNSYHAGSYEPGKGTTGNYVNYEQNSSNPNEFDSMEEYDKTLEYQKSQEVYVP